jgi:signal transduction histidine kinase
MHRILFFLFSIAPLLLAAQEDNFVLRNYTAAHGVPQSQINAMVEDANGYIWLATYGGGLARFDGQHFKVYTTLDGMLNNIVLELKVDAHQNIWTVHPQGVSKFDGVTFKTFPSPTHQINRNAVKRAFVFNDTTFVLSTPGLLGKIYNDSIYYWDRKVMSDRFIYRAYQFKGGELCIILSGGEVFIKSKQGMKAAGNIPKGQTIYSAYRENANLKLETYSPTDFTMMVYEVDPATGSIREEKKVGDYTVLMSSPATHERWIIDKEKRIIRINTKTNAQVIVATDVAINNVLNDSEGNTWLGTNGSGLLKYYHQDFTKIAADKLTGVMAVLKDDETLWAGSMNHGLWKIDSQTQKIFRRNEEILTLAQSSNGTIWAGGMNGLGRLDVRKNEFEWFTTKDGLVSNLIMSIQFDERNGTWITTGNGINYFDGEKFTSYTEKDGLLTNRLQCGYYSKKYKTLYTGSDLGVSTITNGKIDSLKFKEFANTSILSIHPYRDSLLLIGSGGAGFLVYNPVNKQSRIYTTHDGLASDFIYFLASDQEGTIWIGSEKGISRVTLDENLLIKENIHFDHENGLTGVETNQNAFSIAGKEKLFGLIDGLYRYNPVNDTNTRSFDVHLTDVEVFYGEESSRQYGQRVTGAFKIPDQPVFPHHKNHLTFSFNKVDKRYPKSVKFKYQLMNYDKGWSKPAATRQVTYSNLPPGKYEFVVMATTHTGSWAGRPLRYAFTIEAAFYQTASFWVAIALLAVVVIAFIFYWRIRQRVEKAMEREKIRAQEQENLRKEIARDFHDEMGNQLTRIINYVSLLKLNGAVVSSSMSRTELYTKVENSAKYLYTGTRDFIWSIDPVNDDLAKLFIYIRDFGEKLFEEKDIKFRAFNTMKTTLKLPYGFSREANLIFKEVMTNTFKASHAKNASFSLMPYENGFEFVFEDDGVGFDPDSSPAMGGMKNIRERAEKLKARLTVNSITGNGTKISLIFQFENKIKYVTTI